MKTYEEVRREVVKFLKESEITPYDLARISKDLCRCGTCKFFVQHYDQDGKPLDFGHCRKNNRISSKKPYESSCGFWELEEQKQ